MNWKDYEKEIYEYLKIIFKDADIKFNQTLPGRYSKTDRQIDVLIESYIASKKIRLIVDGKFFNTKIDVKDVESFISMVEDTNAQQGILITSKGFTPAAINRAYYGPTDIELDILNFDELKKYQSFGGIIHSGKFGALVPAPFGWVIDATKRTGMLATFYQRGLSFEEAVVNKEWIYTSIYYKDEHLKTLDDLVKFQEGYTRVEFPKAKFEYNSSVKRPDKAATLLRVTSIEEYPTNEYSGFIEFSEFFVLFVLFSPIELANKNVRKLENILERTLPIFVNQESILKSNLGHLEDLARVATDAVELAEILIGQGDILILLNDLDGANKKFDQSIQVLNTSYGAHKGKIQVALMLGKQNDELEKIVAFFYDLQPTNPTICKDVFELFEEYHREKDLIHFLNFGIERYKANKEAMGNFNYHLGQLMMESNNFTEAERYFLVAKEAFKNSLKNGHYVFKLINQNLKSIKKKS